MSDETYFKRLRSGLDEIKAREEARKRSLLYELTDQLATRNPDLESILERILDRAIAMTQADRGFFVLYDENDRMFVRSARGMDSAELAPEEVEFSTTVVDRVTREMQALYLPRITGPLEKANSIARLKLRSVMCAPVKIRVRDRFPEGKEKRSHPGRDLFRILGVIYVDSASEGRVFSEEDLASFEGLANQAASVLVNVTAYVEATTDQLTGLVVRWRFEQLVADEYRLSLRTGDPLTLIMSDISPMRVVNERFGYRVGDKVLARLAGVVRRAIRRSDVCSRYGGDKFAFLLPGTGPHGARKLIERLRSAFCNSRLLEGGPALSLTFGVADLAGGPEGPEDLLRRADQALCHGRERREEVLVWTRDLLGSRQRCDRLAGILTGDNSRDYRNVLILLESIRALSASLSLHELVEMAVDLLVEVNRAESGVLYLVDGGTLNRAAARNHARRNLTTVGEREPAVAAHVADTGESLFTQHQGAAVLAVPLTARGRTIGAVALFREQNPEAFGEADFAFTSALAEEFALALENVRLAEENRSRQDELQSSKQEIEELNRRLEERVQAQERELREARKGLRLQFNYDRIFGRSQAMREVFRMVDRVTSSDIPVTIVGESGTGKELVARTIHHNGARSEGPFVTENCAAIAPSLLESELFGHVRGAFTGAHRDKVGLFEAASGGTLLLDEIGEMSIDLQAKLLRVLEEGKVRPVGSAESRPVDVRIISATNRNLEEMLEKGDFREDLYYRLNVVTIRLPPLRDREGDVPPLAEQFLAEVAGGRARRFTPGALAVLDRHTWPGNVREMRNLVERAVILSDEEEIGDQTVRDLLLGGVHGESPGLDLPFKDAKHEFERTYVLAALERDEWNVTAAARRIGVQRRYLYQLMDRLRIDKKSG